MAGRLLYGLILVVLTFGFSTDCYSESVSMKEARRIARLFFNDAYGEIGGEPKYVFNGKKYTTDRLFTPFYVFDSPEGGFVIISAENKAFPILGYSLLPKGMGFGKDNLSKEDNALLTGFSRDIELIRYDSRYPTEAAAAWENIPATIHETLYSPSIIADGFTRYRPDDNKMWILRERAVEFPYEWPKTDEELRAERESEIEKEYIPFSFYDDFIEETRKAETSKIKELEERLRPSVPLIKSLGGAHFEIHMPQGVEIADIFSADGRLAKRGYYRGSEVLNIDLSDLPNGFYFGLLHLQDGQTKGIKLYR